MTTITVERVIDVPAEKAWAVLEDFGGFLKWAAGGEGKIETEGEGVGMIRHLDLPGLGKMAEKLDVLDTEEMKLGYSLVYGDVGMDEYKATVRIEPLTSDSCKVLWLGDYRAAEGVDLAQGVMTLDAAYKGMSDSLATYAATL